ncbi:MAG: hypothetical protein IJV71_11590 [Lachnospiraceae bacterium]|nr:hypothetical protein [Lachnospiraceae bacterium]
MKELVSKLARGIIEYDVPVLEVSVTEIDRKLYSEKTTEGSFLVYSSNELELEGIVFSTNEYVQIVNKSFLGRKNTIGYRIDGTYLNEGDTVEGNICIVSNGGEAEIPFKFKVDSTSFSSSMGEIKNLFHFANLVQMNYDEALAIFKSPDFVHIFLEDDFYLLSMYEGLKESPNMEMAMEEFLIAANKKKVAKIAISSEGKSYENITEDEGDVIVISKESWGYAYIDIKVDGDFISVEKSKITSNDFAGSNYELQYYIHKDKLHAGNNYGCIEFITKSQRERYTISVQGTEAMSDSPKLYKLGLRDILRRYIDFRVHRINMDRWADDTLNIIERMRGMSDDHIFL